jgi:hypothetical protein
MAGPGGRNASRRKTETADKLFLIIGILLTGSVAGGIWATITSSNYNAEGNGIALGFLIGVALVMTALLASMRPHSES